MTRPGHDLGGRRQAEVMRVMWRLDEATVDDVRSALPPSRWAAYTTVQTVLNRLLDRGLVKRERRGKAFVYRPRYPESELVARSMRDRLADASADARMPALFSLLERLSEDELDELARNVNKVRRERKRR